MSRNLASKKPITGYLLFCQEKREKVKQSDPDATPAEIMKALGAKWKSLSEDKKKDYVDRAKEISGSQSAPSKSTPSKLDKLKAKIASQKSKNIKPEVVVKKVSKSAKKAIMQDDEVKLLKETSKAKKQPAFIPNIKTATKLSKEDEKLREEFDAILAENYSKAMSKTFPEEGDFDKQEYALRYLKKKYESNFNINNVLTKILDLSTELREEFMARYTAQEDNLSNFYTNWIQNNETIIKVKELNDQRDIVKVISQDDYEEIRQDLVARAKEVAIERDVELDDPEEKSYFRILEQISTKPRKLHAKLASDYIGLIEGGEELNLADLINRIVKLKRDIVQNVDPKDSSKVLGLSKKKLIKKAREMNLDIAEEDGKTVLEIKILRELKKNPKSDSRKELIAEAKEYGISDPKSYDDLGLKIAVYTEREKRAKAKSRTVKLSSEFDRKIAIEKLVRLTGNSPDYYSDWTPEEIVQRYEAIQDEQDYQDEVEREAIINSLVSLTDQPREYYDDLETPMLRETLTYLSNKKEQREEIQSEISSSKECISTYTKFGWIEGLVTDVWIDRANDGGNLSAYADASSFIVLKNGDKYYRAKQGFFALLCRSKRQQEGDVLKCVLPSGKTVSFTVGYTVKDGRDSRQTIKKVVIEGTKQKVGKGIGFILQDEKLFEKEQAYLEQNGRDRLAKREKLFNGSLDLELIKIAKSILSKALLKAAPDVKDYEVDSPYINLAIDSYIKPRDPGDQGEIEKKQGVKRLFAAIANLIVYLEMEKAVQFRDRIQLEYYLPEALLYLSPEETLPEVFANISNISSETIDQYSLYIANRTEQLLNAIADTILIDPTTRKGVSPWAVLAKPIPIDVTYDRSVCTNQLSEEVPWESVAYYHDMATDKIYCFDAERLLENFKQNDFINPYTRTKFDKDFLRNFLVIYKDKDAGEIFKLPYIDLLKRFKKEDFINRQTGQPFGKSFIKGILEGGQKLTKSKYFAGEQFKRVDYTTALCRNSSDVSGRSPSEIVYYADEDDEKLYCFTVDKVFDLIENEKGVNPYTEKPFSKSFVSNFTKMFRNKAKEEKNKVELIQANRKPDEELILIPDLWKMIVKDFTNETEEEKQMSESQSDESDTDYEDETVEDEVEDENEDETDEEEYNDEDDGDLDQELADLIQDQKRSQSEIVKESRRAKRAADKANADKANADKANMGFSPENCRQCQQPCKDSNYRSFGMENNKAVQYCFCCSECMEKFSFPRLKKASKVESK